MIGERVDERELMISRKERLVIVRAVQVNKAVPNLFQNRKRSQRSVYELAGAARCRQNSLDQKLSLFTLIHALLFEEAIHVGNFIEIECRFDGALVCARSDQGFVSPFA